MQPKQQRQNLARLTDNKFAALVRMFMSPANPRWTLPQDKGGYAHNTKISWTRALQFAIRPDCLGDLSLQEIRPSLVQAFFDGIADRPGKQKVTLTAFKQVEAWAIVRELLPRQITIGVKIGKLTGGHIPWTEAQVAFARKNLRPDLALVVVLGAYTGQRRGDLVRMCPTDIEIYNGITGINVVQEKTKRALWVPILPALASEMETWERAPGPFLRRLDGRPWHKDHLTDQWEIARARHPELAGLVLHGLRAHACVQLRRAGLSASLIADTVGMSMPMVERYCRFSAQRENATAAVVHLQNAAQERNKAVVGFPQTKLLKSNDT
jgi:integrase